MPHQNAIDPTLDFVLMIVLTSVGILIFAALAVGGYLVARDTIHRRGRWGINSRPGACVKCGEPAPVVRLPKSVREWLWGGWTCSTCGLELDKWGQPEEQLSPQARWAVLEKLREMEERGACPAASSEQVQHRPGHIQPKDHAAESPREGIQGETHA
jgi:hypothetical protein